MLRCVSVRRWVCLSSPIPFRPLSRPAAKKVLGSARFGHSLGKPSRQRQEEDAAKEETSGSVRPGHPFSSSPFCCGKAGQERCMYLRCRAFSGKTPFCRKRPVFAHPFSRIKKARVLQRFLFAPDRQAMCTVQQKQSKDCPPVPCGTAFSHSCPPSFRGCPLFRGTQGLHLFFEHY